MTTPKNRYFAFITIAADSTRQAKLVLAERLGYDENYGFPYTLEYKDPQLMDEDPAENTYTVETPKMSEPNGIVIDASVIRDILEWKMNILDESDVHDRRLIRTHSRIASMSDTELNALIASTDDRRTWELFHEMCDRILDHVVDATVGANPA